MNKSNFKGNMEFKIITEHENVNHKYWEVSFRKNEYSTLQRYRRKQNKETLFVDWQYHNHCEVSQSKNVFLEELFNNTVNGVTKISLEGVTNVRGWSKKMKGNNQKFIQGLVLDALKKYESFKKACDSVGVNKANVQGWIREQPEFKSQYLAIREKQGIEPNHYSRRSPHLSQRPTIDVEEPRYYLPAVSMRFVNSVEKVDENNYTAIGKDGVVNLVFDGDFFYYKSKDYPFEKGDQHILYTRVIEGKAGNFFNKVNKNN